MTGNTSSNSQESVHMSHGFAPYDQCHQMPRSTGGRESTTASILEEVDGVTLTPSGTSTGRWNTHHPKLNSFGRNERSARSLSGDGNFAGLDVLKSFDASTGGLSSRHSMPFITTQLSPRGLQRTRPGPAQDIPYPPPTSQPPSHTGTQAPAHSPHPPAITQQMGHKGFFQDDPYLPSRSLLPRMDALQPPPRNGQLESKASFHGLMPSSQLPAHAGSMQRRAGSIPGVPHLPFSSLPESHAGSCQDDMHSLLGGLQPLHSTYLTPSLQHLGQKEPGSLLDTTTPALWSPPCNDALPYPCTPPSHPAFRDTPLDLEGLVHSIQLSQSGSQPLLHQGFIPDIPYTPYPITTSQPPSNTDSLQEPVTPRPGSQHTNHKGFLLDIPYPLPTSRPPSLSGSIPDAPQPSPRRAQLDHRGSYNSIPPPSPRSIQTSLSGSLQEVRRLQAPSTGPQLGHRASFFRSPQSTNSGIQQPGHPGGLQGSLHLFGRSSQDHPGLVPSTPLSPTGSLHTVFRGGLHASPHTGPRNHPTDLRASPHDTPQSPTPTHPHSVVLGGPHTGQKGFIPDIRYPAVIGHPSLYGMGDVGPDLADRKSYPGGGEEPRARTRGSFSVVSSSGTRGPSNSGSLLDGVLDDQPWRSGGYRGPSSSGTSPHGGDMRDRLSPTQIVTWLGGYKE